MRGGRHSSRSAARLIPLVMAMLALVLPAAGEAAVTGSITGTVTAKVGGAPLAGAEVCAEGVGALEEEFDCASTNSSGRYEIAALAPGEYKVEFWAAGIGYVRQFYDGQSSWTDATPVMVAAGVPTAGIDAELERGASISGVVRAAATGLPVEGVEVCAVGTDVSGFGCGDSNSGGAYLIQGLPAGSYEVEFDAYETGQNLLSQQYELGLVTLAAGQQRTGVNAALQTGGQIAGTVRMAATGAPLKGVEVCVVEASEEWALACLETPASGAYRFLGVWTGSFKVVFSPVADELEGEYGELHADGLPTQWWNGQPTFATATPIGVTAGATVSGIDGSFGPGPTVPPVITTPNAPLPPPPGRVIAKPTTEPGPPMRPRRKCKHGSVRRRVHGKVRCVKRHGKHHARPRRHSKHSSR